MTYMRYIKFAIAITLALGGTTSCRRKESMADRIVMAQAGNKELDAAIEKAVSELPLFWDRFDHPKPGDDSFSVKISINDANGYEYFFLDDIKRSGDSVSGVIDAQPQIVKCVTLNQRVEVPANKVVDWLFMANFTSRALINDIPKEDRELLIRLFDPNPSIRGGA